MTRPRKYVLNARQLALLRRIVEGVVPVTSDEPQLALTVYALRDRGLVEAKRRGGRWTATATADGRSFAETGRHPGEGPPPVTRAPAAPRRPPKPSTTIALAVDTDADTQASLVAPTLTLVIPVPDRLTRAHPVVEAARDALKDCRPDDTRRLCLHRPGLPSLHVSRPAVGRALRLLQAVASEAGRRGYAFTTRGGSIGATLTCGGHVTQIVLREETDKSPHEATAADLARQRSAPWFTPAKYDHSPSGRLCLELDPYYDRGSTGRRRSWRDTARRALDEQLPAMFAELEARVELAAVAQAARELKQQELDRAAAHAREVATARYLQDAQRAALRTQVADWLLATQLREAAHEMERRAQERAERTSESVAWVDAARRYADELDDKGDVLHLPTPPAVTDQALQPYLPARRYVWQ